MLCTVESVKALTGLLNAPGAALSVICEMLGKTLVVRATRAASWHVRTPNACLESSLVACAHY